jgi:diacylglycerol O-acyltransferase / wax synthase
VCWVRSWLLALRAEDPSGRSTLLVRQIPDRNRTLSPLIGHPVHNLIVSNVPGPQAQLYFLGCEVEAMYPLGPLFHGCGLNVTAMSLNGKLNVGVISCPDLLPDLWRLVDDFDVALEELLECTGPAHV